MAWGGAGPGPLLLGFQDAPMLSEKAEFTVSKVGGAADWCAGAGQPGPRCGGCGAELVLVCQVYAPLAGSPHHRTLYLFACLLPPCWGQPAAWVALRQQSLAVAGTGESERPAPAPPSDWGVAGAEDWGEEEEDDNGNSWLGAGAGGGTGLSVKGVLDGGLGLQLSNLNIRNSRENQNDRNSNQGAGGGGGVVATAEVEMDGTGEADDSALLIESPNLPSSNIPELFSAKNCSDLGPGPGARLEPFYLAVGEEEEAGTGEHEAALLAEYQTREGEVVVQTGNGAGAGDSYEKALPSHGDLDFHQFSEVIGRAPGQLLRYCRAGEPLPLSRGPARPPPAAACPHCGAPLQFELQLLPSLVSLLRVRGRAGPALEFGTVMVFTCSRSCWGEGDTPRQETLILQAETM